MRCFLVAASFARATPPPRASSSPSLAAHLSKRSGAKRAFQRVRPHARDVTRTARHAGARRNGVRMSHALGRPLAAPTRRWTPPRSRRRAGVVAATADDARQARLDAAAAQLPIACVVKEALEALEASPNAVLQAPPGAGKTTVLPLALCFDKPDGYDVTQARRTIIVLEPRRLAAKAAAARMASMLGERVGETVGYHVRFDRVVGRDTRVEVVTEGVLVRRLRADAELRDVAAVIFDEFHERNLDADVALALCREVQQTIRPDLRLLVMSATLGQVGARVAKLLTDDASVEGGAGEVPIIVSEGKSYPVETIYCGAPGVGFGELERATTSAVLTAVRAASEGDVLCFLPGAAEINRVIRELRRELPANVDAVPLYGALTPDEQNLALAPSKPGRRRVVVSTPIAESSLTISGVTVVVDSGLCKSPKFDARKGMTRLETTRISKASADQRRGRAGRVAPGTCYRLWGEALNSKLAPDTTPEILQADLTPVALDLATWGVGDGASMAWLDPPPEGPLIAARRLLRALGAFEDDRDVPSAIGELMSELPVHPRLARMLLFGASRGAESARLACQLAAVVGDRDLISGRDAPLDIRTRLRALWGQDPLGGEGIADAPPPPPTDASGPTRVPIGTKLPKSGKKIKGAPRGKRASVNSAVSTATGGATGANFNVDERAVAEATKVSEQLLGHLRRLAKTHPDFCAPGVGEGDPAGVVWSFLCGASDSEAGVLLAMAYPDRVAARKSRGGAFQLSGGGAASVGADHKDDALLRTEDKTNETLVIVELAGDGAGNAGSRNDRIRLAAPISRACFEGPDGPLFEALAEERDDVFWTSASKAVFARKRLAVGELVLREVPFSVKDSDATIPAMLEGVREMGLAGAFGLSKNTVTWLKRCEFVHRSGVDPTFPDLSECALLSSADEWLAPWLAGATSKADLSKIDVSSLLRNTMSYEHSQLVDSSCPTHVLLPSGTNCPVNYEGDIPVVAARLQELFGCDVTPTVGGVAVELHLLSPASRPVQITRDLASFWREAYVDVRKELAGRYPKHYWPLNPLEAEATNRAKPRKT